MVEKANAHPASNEHRAIEACGIPVFMRLGYNASPLQATNEWLMTDRVRCLPAHHSSLVRRALQFLQILSGQRVIRIDLEGALEMCLGFGEKSHLR